MGAVQIGVDIGGTFTDIAVLDEDTGQITIAKVASRRGDPGGALIDAVGRGSELAEVDPNNVTMLVHGTTIVTNAVLENNLSRTALVTTEGFRDVLEIGRHFRPDMYDLLQDKLQPIIPRERRFCISERTTSDGEIIQELELGAMDRLCEEISDRKYEAVAICFLNSYVNPSNEATVRDWLRQRLPGIYVSASFDVCREIREFERMSTVALNAAAMPLVAEYLSEIETRVGAVLHNASALLMQSNGGSLTLSAAQAYPARMIKSGPAGGALAVQRIAKATAHPRLLGVDMGGTSTDISLIHNGDVRMTTEGAIGEHPVKLPMIEINTIGAGAGSIAWLDGAKGLHVGPRSAGSEPGPVAYGRGGTEPTVTDASLVLGRLHPDRFAGGQMILDLEAARQAITDKTAKPRGLSVEEAAAGIIRIANANMEKAIRVSSAEKGYDPRNITLVAFGGAGPMHAAALAKAVSIPTVLVPNQPGVFSAVGLVMADIRHDFVESRILRRQQMTAESLGPLYAALEQSADEALTEDGIPPGDRQLRRSADLRYVGQAYEVNVPAPDGVLDGAAIEATVQRFHELHQQLYAHNHPDKAVEFVSGRVAAIGLTSAPPLKKLERGGRAAPPREGRPVYFEESGGFVDTDVVDRGTLGPGSTLTGPAIVEQVDSTTVIHPQQKASVDELGNLLISV